MPVMSNKAFNDTLALARKDTAALIAAIQEMLINGVYYTMKDGDPGNLNRVLDMATNLKAVDTTRITNWVVLHSKCATVEKGAFVCSKAFRKQHVVTNESDFEPFEAELRKLSWRDSKGRTVNKNPWELDAYLESVLKQLAKHETDVDADVEAIIAAKQAITQVKATAAMSA